MSEFEGQWPWAVPHELRSRVASHGSSILLFLETRESMLGPSRRRGAGSASNCYSRSFTTSEIGYQRGSYDSTTYNNLYSIGMYAGTKIRKMLDIRGQRKAGSSTIFCSGKLACSMRAAKEMLSQLVCRSQNGTKCSLICSEVSVLFTVIGLAPCRSAEPTGRVG